MEAAKQINHFTERLRDLEDALALLKNAKVALESEGADEIYTFNEVNAAKQALEELILHHPDFKQDIELGLIAVPAREQISGLINLKGLKNKLQNEGEAIKKIIANLEALTQVSLIMLKAKANGLSVTNIGANENSSAHNETQNPAPAESVPESIVANRAQIGSLLNEIPDLTSSAPEGQSEVIIDATEKDKQETAEYKKYHKEAALAPTPEPHILDINEEAEARRLLAEDIKRAEEEDEAERKREEAAAAEERETERIINNHQAIWDFIMEDLGIDHKDQSPIPKAIRSTLYRHALDKDLDIENLKEFMEDPNIIAKERLDELEKARLKNRDALNETLGEIEVLQARLTALGKQTKGPSESAPDPKESGRLKSKKAALEEEREAIKAEMEALNKVGPAGEREYNSPESKLIMINYYFAYKDSQKKDAKGKIGKSPKWKEILETSHKSIEAAETAELERRKEWSWGGLFDKFTGLFRPTLESTLEAIGKKDEAIGKIDKAHLMKLTSVVDEDKGMDQWIAGLKGEKKEKMESTLPTLIAHLEIAMNEGNAANLNTLSQSYTAELLNQLRKAVRDYALSQAKLKKDGDNLTRLDTYFETFNGVMDTKGAVSKDLIMGYVDKRIFRNIAGPLAGTATTVGAFSIPLIFGPAAGFIGAGSLLAGYLGIKGFKEKDPAKKAALKKWGLRSAISTALTTTAWVTLGVTSWPILAGLGAAGVGADMLIRNRKNLSSKSEAPSSAEAPTPEPDQTPGSALPALPANSK